MRNGVAVPLRIECPIEVGTLEIEHAQKRRCEIEVRLGLPQRFPVETKGAYVELAARPASVLPGPEAIDALSNVPRVHPPVDQGEAHTIGARGIRVAVGLGVYQRRQQPRIHRELCAVPYDPGGVSNEVGLIDLRRADLSECAGERAWCDLRGGGRFGRPLLEVEETDPAWAQPEAAHLVGSELTLRPRFRVTCRVVQDDTLA